MKINIFGLIAVFLLSACALPLSSEQWQQKRICGSEASLTPDGSYSQSYQDFCVHNFAQRDNELAAGLKVADPYHMCHFTFTSPLVSEAIKERGIDCPQVEREYPVKVAAENRQREILKEQQARESVPNLSPNVLCNKWYYRSGIEPYEVSLVDAEVDKRGIDCAAIISVQNQQNQQQQMQQQQKALAQQAWQRCDSLAQSARTGAIASDRSGSLMGSYGAGEKAYADRALACGPYPQ
jgi:hypothetical protein